MTERNIVAELGVFARDKSITPEEFDEKARELWEECPEGDKHRFLWALYHDIHCLIQKRER